ncbi:transmembrane protein, putative (macronuclear) [Tetrahymena thermophila SB210]|uniref:Transmembrane protein, putative n=1 Tax=Tetrahymena thermophila (strain SB210) TaxID=312017 RepID=A4VDE0_TETTS|nr:transmembrane protein, putative [Tetrahymena thermophila SB210]EDK31547.1 transmembrane protein, putative [Tetrahymena thermophila SB210]|eukprot:XP_001471428.1 transmembrane protein, putative [Tetrahymena thermophila SB210]
MIDLFCQSFTLMLIFLHRFVCLIALIMTRRLQFIRQNNNFILTSLQMMIYRIYFIQNLYQGIPIDSMLLSGKTFDIQPRSNVDIHKQCDLQFKKSKFSFRNGISRNMIYILQISSQQNFSMLLNQQMINRSSIFQFISLQIFSI